MIKEWNLLRVVACLSIVFLHSTTTIASVEGYVNVPHYQFLRALLCYATPTFIIISEVILSHRYPDRLPEQFWTKKVKYLYVPFLIFAVIDAFVANHIAPTIVISDRFIQNLFSGTFAGYFVIIIFQFYVLHFLVTKFKISMKFLVPFSFIIMLIHLYIINSNLAFVHTYSHYIFLPFTAWFGYFTIAFVIGKNYQRISKSLFKYKWLLLIGVVFTFFIIYTTYFQMGYTNINSRRLDLFPFVIVFSLFVMAWGQYLPNNRIILFLNNYSFGIYLVHWQVQRLIAPYVADLFDHTFTQVIGMFTISLAVSIIIIFIISLLPFGSYIVGRTKREINNSKISNDVRQFPL